MEQFYQDVVLGFELQISFVWSLHNIRGFSVSECHFFAFSVSQLRREKIDLENTLEQEQEALVNRLWKRMDKLEAEKR